MKKTLLVFLSFYTFGATAHDLYFLPKSFFLKKNDSFICRLFIGDDFIKELEEKPIRNNVMNGYHWLNATGNYDLAGHYPDSTMPVFHEKARVEGQQLLAMERGYSHIKFGAEKFTAYLKAEHLDDILKLREGLPAKDTEREKYTRYIKTLVAVGKPVGELYRKRLGQKLEIILMQNPYAVARGGMISAQLFFRDKPLVNGSVEILCKDASGKIFINPVKTDKNGKVAFRIDQPGDWMVRITHMIPCRDTDADWESFWASYTFGVR